VRDPFDLFGFLLETVGDVAVHWLPEMSRRTAYLLLLLLVVAVTTAAMLFTEGVARWVVLGVGGACCVGLGVLWAGADRE
jgi:1,4-dihydroxy-2-naphthoate octaprenyltransferase